MPNLPNLPNMSIIQNGKIGQNMFNSEKNWLLLDVLGFFAQNSILLPNIDFFETHASTFKIKGIPIKPVPALITSFFIFIWPSEFK